MFKEDDAQSKTNYRPISLLFCLSKILEKIVAIRFHNYLIGNSLLTAKQSGFVPRDSTVNQLVFFVNKILKPLTGQELRAVFLDISIGKLGSWEVGKLGEDSSSWETTPLRVMAFLRYSRVLPTSRVFRSGYIKLKSVLYFLNLLLLFYYSHVAPK